MAPFNSTSKKTPPPSIDTRWWSQQPFVLHPSSWPQTIQPLTPRHLLGQTPFTVPAEGALGSRYWYVWGQLLGSNYHPSAPSQQIRLPLSQPKTPTGPTYAPMSADLPLDWYLSPLLLVNCISRARACRHDEKGSCVNKHRKCRTIPGTSPTYKNPSPPPPPRYTQTLRVTSYFIQRMYTGISFYVRQSPFQIKTPPYSKRHSVK